MLKRFRQHDGHFPRRGRGGHGRSYNSAVTEEKAGAFELGTDGPEVTDSAKLRPDSTPALHAVLALINEHPGSRWIISGHTDNQGNSAHNETLSQNRAASVIVWLKSHGADPSRVGPQGFGASRPVADNATANGRALNRRVEIAPVSK